MWLRFFEPTEEFGLHRQKGDSAHCPEEQQCQGGTELQQASSLPAVGQQPAVPQDWQAACSCAAQQELPAVTRYHSGQQGQRTQPPLQQQFGQLPAGGRTSSLQVLRTLSAYRTGGMLLQPAVQRDDQPTLYHRDQHQIQTPPEGSGRPCRPSAQGSCGEQALPESPDRNHQRLPPLQPEPRVHREPHHKLSLNVSAACPRQALHTETSAAGCSVPCSRPCQTVRGHIHQQPCTCCQYRQTGSCHTDPLHHRHHRDLASSEEPQAARDLHTYKDWGCQHNKIL